MHGLAKAGLFLCAGVVEQRTKVKDITKLGGLIATMPVTAISFLFCALSVMGVPPFGGFFSKYMVFAGAVESGQLMVGLGFLVGAFMTILYLWRVFNMVFLGPPQPHAVQEGDTVMLVSIAILGLLSLAGGIFINYPSRFAEAVVVSLSRVAR
jgi:NADH-quinone oxidoreductase subunit L